MSLPALALLICLTMALRETLGDRAKVLMMPGDPLAEALQLDVPVVAIFAGGETLSPKARRLLDTQRTAEVTVQAILPAGPVILGADDAETEVDTHNAGAAFTFAWLYRGIEAAFELDGRWSERLRGFALGFDGEVEAAAFRLEMQRGEPPVTTRTSAVEIVLPCKLIESPELGSAPYDPWSDLIAGVASEPSLAQVADLLASLIAGELLPSWRIEQALLGLSHAERVALGLGPSAGHDAEPAATSLTVTSNGVAHVVVPDP